MRKVYNLLGRAWHVLSGRAPLTTVGTRSHVDWWRLRRGLGRIAIGSHSSVSCRISFDAEDAIVRIGDRCFIGASQLVCRSKIDIADDVLISWGVTISDHDSHSLDVTQRREDVMQWASGKKLWDGVKVSPVVIQTGVWIGFGATVLKGVVLGRGCVVGAGSVVTKNVPDFALVAGNPARIVRMLKRDDE